MVLVEIVLTTPAVITCRVDAIVVVVVAVVREVVPFAGFVAPEEANVGAFVGVFVLLDGVVNVVDAVVLRTAEGYSADLILPVKY